MDPCSYTDASVFLTKSIDFDWTINFEKRLISGTAALECEILKDGVNELVFDTRALNIENISIGDAKCNFEYGLGLQNYF